MNHALRWFLPPVQSGFTLQHQVCLIYLKTSGLPHGAFQEGT
jgi:hypothetical protein